MGREVEGGIGMGKTCETNSFSFQSMTKFTTNKKKKKRKKNKIKYEHWDYTGSPMVKNPPANAGDTGSISGLGRSHMP